MNEIELKMMQGMVSILNCEGVLTKEQYESRLEDLREFEKETNFILLNSPTQNLDLKSILDEFEVCELEIHELNDVEDIVKNFNQKETMVYAKLVGTNVCILYVDGIIKKIYTKDAECLRHVCNIPYKINKEGAYYIFGKVVSVDGQSKFFLDDVIDDVVDNNINNKFEKAKELGFDIVSHWFASGLNPKTLQSTIEYVFDYIKEDELPCNSIIFRSNDALNKEVFEFKNKEDENNG